MKLSRRLVLTETEIPTGTKVMMYGDSITANAYTSNPDLGYPKQYSIASGYDVQTVARYSRSIIEGLVSYNSGNSLQDMIENITDLYHQEYDPILSYNPDVIALTFRLGVNDVLQFCSNDLVPEWYTNGARDVERFIAVFKENYIRSLQYFHNIKGWPMNKMYLINMGYYGGEDLLTKQIFDRINQAITEVASFLNIKLIDINSFVTAGNPNNSLGWYGDYVHPNDTGHPLEGQWLATKVP